MILPIVHPNGTSRASLVDLRCAAGAKLREALEALSAMAPHGRDYYLEEGRFEAAVAQHQRRVFMVREVWKEIQDETIAISKL